MDQENIPSEEPLIDTAAAERFTLCNVLLATILLIVVSLSYFHGPKAAKAGLSSECLPSPRADAAVQSPAASAACLVPVGLQLTYSVRGN